MDALRGVAAILVVAGHIQAIAFLGSDSLQHMYLCVDFFFMLSGFVIARAYEHRMLAGLKPREYAAIRLVRLYPLIALGAVLGFLAATVGVFSTSTPELRLIAQLLFIPSLWVAGQVFDLNNVQWSLLIELVVNAIHFRLAKWLTLSRLLAIVVLSGGILIAAVNYYGIGGLGVTRETYLASFARGAFGFFIGVFLFRLSRKGWLPAIGAPWPVVVLALPAVVLGATLPFLEWRWYADLALTIFVLPVILWVGIFSRLPTGLERVAKFLGDLSYPVYALHLPLIFFLKALTVKAFGSGVPAPLLCVAWFGVIFSVSWLAMKFVDEPIQAWFAARSRKSPLPAS
ncbi:acyltransferase family protein [Brevundimonas variabilis]|uniref:Peptidoglycan/LPS O-acetylase OafA/YrhL n=1 Tax=Brevundimonas variabilis TaxID=74312 RepID=A0A7W9CKK5_9CAUL|nr:acyltransferase [Brevundimonas variabilis]MBB5747420.1 peptidoglycan/LPS O-acetylase OafA/YrhL [Brevundimonas variabilis]